MNGAKDIMDATEPPFNVSTDTDGAQSCTDALLRVTTEPDSQTPYGNSMSDAAVTGLPKESGRDLMAKTYARDIGPDRNSKRNRRHHVVTR